MDTSPNLQLAYLIAAQSQKHVTYNESMRALDALVQQAVLDKDLATPPSSPADGDRYIVAVSPTGAWAGQAGKVAAYQDGAWAFYTPREGWLAWVADEDVVYAHDGAAWDVLSIAGGGATLDTLGALTPAADRLPYFTGDSSAALAPFTSFGRSLVDDADASAARATLGLTLGTSGATVPLLNGVNTWSAAQTFLANLQLSKALITAAAATGNFPSVAADEQLLQISLAGGNVLSVQNTHAGGYSAFTARGSDGREYLAAGYGNPSAAAIFAGRNYIQSWSGRETAAAPVPLLLSCDGAFGRTGSVGGFHFYQRCTVDQFGTRFWKEVAYDSGTEQVPIAEFSAGGHFAILNTSEPAAIDIPTSALAFWYDSTAGSPDIRFKGRDANGALFAGSVAIGSAVSATLSDDFSEADDDDSLTAGKAADAGGNWAASDSDHWGVISNKAYRSNGSADSYAYIDSGLSNVCVECDITLSSVRANAGLVLRGTDASNYLYIALHKDGGNDKIQAFNVVSGSFTEMTPIYSLSSTGVTESSAVSGLSLGQTYAVRAGIVGNSIFVYIDGVLRRRFDLPATAAGTRQGLWSYQHASTEDDLGSRWDNFKVFA